MFKSEHLRTVPNVQEGKKSKWKDKMVIPLKNFLKI